MDADDFVELPYEREGFHKKCISHPKEITSLSLGGYYDEDYCWYGFNETAMCEGRPSEMEKLPAHSEFKPKRERTLTVQVATACSCWSKEDSSLPSSKR